MGHNVVQARNGAEAIASFQKTKVDLVITDLLMPEKDGFETIRRFRKLSPGLKIIAMSGGGQIGPALYLDLAEQLGAGSVLVKPFSTDDLTAAVTKAFRAEHS